MTGTREDKSMRRTLRNVFVGTAAVALGVLGFAGAASAHVTVNPNTATQGGYARIAFRVPTESDTASTTKLEVQLDTTHPVASVSTMPVPGWTATTTTAQLATPLTDDDGNKITQAVSQITWTANSADTAIKPGQFQEFPVSLGPLPKTDKLVFKALQTYSDGSVVRWIDEAAPGQAEPEHPAPVLSLSAATSDDAPAATTTKAAAAPSSSGGSNDTAALTVGVIGAVLGLVGLILGGLAFLRTRRPSSAP
jgi:periplasmic copper chaperone A